MDTLIIEPSWIVLKNRELDIQEKSIFFCNFGQFSLKVSCATNQIVADFLDQKIADI